MTTLPSINDAKKAFTAKSVFDVDYMQDVEDRLYALGGESARVRNQPYTNAYPKADPDSPALPAGKAVAMKHTGESSDPVMVLSTAANLAAGAVHFGVLCEATLPGARGRVAIAGIVPSAITGLLESSDQYIRAHATTAALERVASFGAGDTAVGIARSDGAVVLSGAAAASGAGSVGTVTNPGYLAISNDTNNYQPTAVQLQSGIHDFSGQTAERVVLYPRQRVQTIRNSGTFDILAQGQTGGAGSGDIVRINPGVETTVYFDSINARPVGAPTVEGVALPVFGVDTNLTLVSSFYQSEQLRVTSSVSLTQTRNVEQPLVRGARHIVENATTGNQAIAFGSSTGAKVTISNGSIVEVVCDGTDWKQVGNAPILLSVLDANSLAMVRAPHQILIVKRTTTNATGVTLPPSPKNSDRVEVKLHEGSSASTVTLTPSSGTVKNGATLAFSALGTAYTLVWVAALTDWVVV